MLERIALESATMIVGEFTLNLSTAELECDGIRTRLQDKPFQVLRMLMEQAGQLVTREQLFERLWPRGSYVEFEMGLNTAVRKLRTALGDNAEAPRYIETLPRRGYRLLAPVGSPTLSASEPDALQSPASVPPGEAPCGAVAPEQAGSPAFEAAAADAREPGPLEPEATADEPASPEPQPSGGPPAPAAWHRWVPATAVVLVLAFGYLLAEGLWRARDAVNFRATAAAAPRTAAEATPPAVSEQSIAVLPFVDMSEGKDQEYFSDGLSEELIERLGKTSGLRVIARTSSFYFKGRAGKLETIADELRVANVLEGSVRKSGNRLRVTAQLIRAQTSEHVWSETFDRDLHDVFKVQDEIAAAVVSALKVRLMPEQGTVADAPHTQNVEAYNEYLQGRQSYNQGDAAGYQRSVMAFRAATRLDPGYAAAYADLALAQFWLADGTTDATGYQAALAAAERAVTLAPELAAGYSARGFLRAVYRFDFAGAQADLERAVALSPHDALVLHRSAVLLGIRGELPAAIAREEKALELDPLSEEICRRLGYFFVANQQFRQARLLYEKALAIAPNSDRARNNLGDLELLERQPQQALASYRRIGIGELSLAGQAKAEYALGHARESQQVLQQLIGRYGTAAAGLIARVYASRGEQDQAFDWAERAYVQRDPGITWFRIDPDFRTLRADPRYQALLRRMRLPD